MLTKTTTGSTSTAEATDDVYLRAILVDDRTGAVIEAAPLSSCSDAIPGCVNQGGRGWGVMLDATLSAMPFGGTRSVSAATRA